VYENSHACSFVAHRPRLAVASTGGKSLQLRRKFIPECSTCLQPSPPQCSGQAAAVLSSLALSVVIVSLKAGEGFSVQRQSYFSVLFFAKG
jgi:hypothetical protein